MPTVIRSISKRGARFYEEDGQIMVVIHLDGSTRVGPRLATPDDMAEHAEAYAAFLANTPPEPPAPLTTALTPAGVELPPDVGSVAKPRGAKAA